MTEETTLYERLCSFENLLYAYRRAARGKRNKRRQGKPAQADLVADRE